MCADAGNIVAERHQHNDAAACVLMLRWLLQRDLNSLTQDMALTVAEAASQALWGSGYHSSLQGISPTADQINTLSQLGNMCITCVALLCLLRPIFRAHPCIHARTRPPMQMKTVEQLWAK